jgi:polysaccharide pyruvyl transferase WcaK-like protein
MPYLSTRSSAGTRMMREVLGRPDVEFNPDIAFALHDPAALRAPAVPVRPRLGINLMTFYVLVEGHRRFAPDMTMKTLVADRSFAPLIDTAGERFVRVMRELAGDALRRGWEVVNIPFSAVDAMFADAVLPDLDVRRLPYVGDARTALRHLASCSKFVATRFHAHIFGLIAGIPTVSIAYSGKCEQLWRDLGLEDRQQVSRLDVCRDPGGAAEKLLAWDGLALPPATLAKLAADARAASRKALAAAAAA